MTIQKRMKAIFYIFIFTGVLQGSLWGMFRTSSLHTQPFSFEDDDSSSEINMRGHASVESNYLQPHPTISRLQRSYDQLPFDTYPKQQTDTLGVDVNVFWLRQIAAKGITREAPFISQDQLAALRQEQAIHDRKHARALDKILWSQRICVGQWNLSGMAFHGPFKQVKALCFEDPYNLNPQLLADILQEYPSLIYLDLRGAPSSIIALIHLIKEQYPSLAIWGDAHSFWRHFLSEELGLNKDHPFLSTEQIQKLNHKKQEVEREAPQLLEALETNLWSQRISIENLMRNRAYSQQHSFAHIRALSFVDPHKIEPSHLNLIPLLFPHLTHLDLRGALPALRDHILFLHNRYPELHIEAEKLSPAPSQHNSFDKGNPFRVEARVPSQSSSFNRNSFFIAPGSQNSSFNKDSPFTVMEQ